jgi:hypothetical protein
MTPTKECIHIMDATDDFVPSNIPAEPSRLSTPPAQEGKGLGPLGERFRPTADDDKNTASYLDAWLRGDKAKAQDLSDAQARQLEARESNPQNLTVLAGRTVDPSAPLPAAPPPAPIPDATLQHATRVLQAQEGGQAIIDEWGADLGANLAYAREYGEYIRQSSPALFAKLNQLGDDPDVLREAARLGRLFAGFHGTAR